MFTVLVVFLLLDSSFVHFLSEGDNSRKNKFVLIFSIKSGASVSSYIHARACCSCAMKHVIVVNADALAAFLSRYVKGQ